VRGLKSPGERRRVGGIQAREIEVAGRLHEAEVEELLPNVVHRGPRELPVRGDEPRERGPARLEKLRYLFGERENRRHDDRSVRAGHARGLVAVGRVEPVLEEREFENVVPELPLPLEILGPGRGLREERAETPVAARHPPHSQVELLGVSRAVTETQKGSSEEDGPEAAVVPGVLRHG
jgi:hypothetical protein